MLYVVIVAGAVVALALLARWGFRALRELDELESLSERELGTLAAVVPLWDRTRPASWPRPEDPPWTPRADAVTSPTRSSTRSSA
jgi:hypothetical protein